MNAASGRVVLKRGREKSSRNRHPWVFSGAVDRVEGETAPGSIADLFEANGEFLARGFYNPRSQIVFRALTRSKEEIDVAFLCRRITAATALRQQLVAGEADAYRLVHGEGDELPGLIVDRYGDHLVCQLGTAGMERMRDLVFDALEQVLKPRGIWERGEGPSRKEEGLPEHSALARGAEPPEHVVVTERGLRFAVDIRAGHKTGFYLDQRPGRALVRALAGGRRVLDAFAFSGGFAVNAAAGGAASVLAVDASAESLALVPEHLRLNGLAEDAVRTETGDVFQVLRKTEETFDLIVLDPPPFAKRKAEVEGAVRGYKDVNLHAMLRLSPGGYLLTSSCSHHVDPWLFQQVLFGAAKDAGRTMQIISRAGQPPDHPVSLYHPEGEYLKVFLLRSAGL